MHPKEFVDIEVNPMKCMELCVLFLKIGGLWVTDDMSQKAAIAYKSYKSFVVTLFCSFSFGIFSQLLVSWGDLDDMLESIVIGISLAIISFKLHVLWFRMDEVQHIVTAVKENFYVHEEKLTIENRKIIKMTIDFARKIAISYAAMVITSFAVYNFLSPWLNQEQGDKSETQNVTNVSYSEPNFPVKFWFPVDVTESPRYELAYTFLATIGLVNALNFVGIDVFCMSSIFFITGQFELLCDSVRNVSERVKYKIQASGVKEKEEETDTSEGPRNISRLGHSEHPFSCDFKMNAQEGNMTISTNEFTSLQRDEIDEFFNRSSTDSALGIPDVSCASLRLQRETEKYLVECIKHHQRLLDFSEKLDLLWTTVFFVQFLTASLLICFLGYQAMSMEIDMNYIKMAGYLVCVLFQLGLYCAFGSNLTSQSEAVFNAVYESEWYSQSEYYKQCTIMFIMRAQRPVELTAGRFGTLSLPLFASMLRSSYSYMALLRQMQED